jgi:hypothetical protein
VVLTNPCPEGGREWKDMSQDRRRREILLDRLQPAHEVCKLVLFATSTAINGVDDSRQVYV